MASHVKIDLKKFKQIQKNPKPILEALGKECRIQAESVITRALPNTPISEDPPEDGQPRLKDTSFVDGPEQSTKHKSVTATCGYTAPYAAYEHEGTHYGRQGEKNQWLKKAARPGRAKFKRRIGAVLMETLEKLFSGK